MIEGKARWVIVDENGKIINRNPNKEMLRYLGEWLYKKGRFTNITEEELLEFMRQFYKGNGRVPVENDFTNNYKYPSHATYVRVFGCWDSAIQMAGLWDKRHRKGGPCRYIGEELLEYRQYNIENMKEYEITEKFADVKSDWKDRQIGKKN